MYVFSINKTVHRIYIYKLIWIYVDTKNTTIISNLSVSTFWLVILTLKNLFWLSANGQIINN